MSLITLQGVDYGVGGPLLLESVNLTIERNERVCIVGRNGAGKSTLLRLLAGSITPDDGSIKREGRIAGLAQEVPKDLGGSVFDVVSMGLGALVSGLKRARAHDGDLRLAGPSDHVAQVLAITRLDAAFQVTDTVDDALATTPG